MNSYNQQITQQDILLINPLTSPGVFVVIKKQLFTNQALWPELQDTSEWPIKKWIITDR